MKYLFGFEAGEKAPGRCRSTWPCKSTGEGTQTVAIMTRDGLADDIEAWIEFTATLGDAKSWTTDGMEILEDTPELLRVRSTGPGPLFFRVGVRLGG